MREALRLLEERIQLRELRLEELRREIQKGIDSGTATPLDMEEIKTRGRKRLAAQQGEGWNPDAAAFIETGKPKATLTKYGGISHRKVPKMRTDFLVDIKFLTEKKITSFAIFCT